MNGTSGTVSKYAKLLTKLHAATKKTCMRGRGVAAGRGALAAAAAMPPPAIMFLAAKPYRAHGPLSPASAQGERVAERKTAQQEIIRGVLLREKERAPRTKKKTSCQ
jgi:hypothetical protein